MRSHLMQPENSNSSTKQKHGSNFFLVSDYASGVLVCNAFKLSLNFTLSLWVIIFPSCLMLNDIRAPA